MFDRFKSQIDRRDLSRQNLYSVFVPRLSEDENRLCNDVQIPSPNIITWDYKHQGPIDKIPYDVTYTPLVMTFLTFGDDGQPYGKFDDWLNEIFDVSWRFNDKPDYVEQVIVRELSRQGGVIKTHKFYDAFPISIGEKPKSNEARNTADTFTVTLEYRYKTTE